MKKLCHKGSPTQEDIQGSPAIPGQPLFYQFPVLWKAQGRSYALAMRRSRIPSLPLWSL